MAEIAYKDMAAYLQAARKKGFSRAYLVFGEPYLRQGAVKALIEAVVPDEKDRDLCLEEVDTTEGGTVSEAAERAGTFSFFSGSKVVLLKAPALFAGTFDPSKHMEKIRAAKEAGEIAKAARLLAQVLERRGCRPEDIIGAESARIAELLQMDPDRHPDLSWLAGIAEQCRDLPDADGKGGAGDAGILLSALKRGLPRNHCLIISTDSADRRTALYKAFKEQGTVINCAVSTGNRKAERDEQRRVLARIAQETLAPHRKSLDPAAFDQVYQRVGFDPGAFAAGVEKLALFVSDRSRIEADDVAAVLEQSREDPVYLFTGAVAGRDADLAIYYLHSLLASGFHYMQLLSAMVNQLRRLIAVKSFVSEAKSAAWRPGMDYERFRQRVMPAVIEHDRALSRYVQESKVRLQPEAGAKKGGATDLVIAKNPKSLYPVYQTFVQSDRFDLEELMEAIGRLHQADLQLKRTGRSPTAVLEAAILWICNNSEKTGRQNDAAT